MPRKSHRATAALVLSAVAVFFALGGEPAGGAPKQLMRLKRLTGLVAVLLALSAPAAWAAFDPDAILPVQDTRHHVFISPAADGKTGHVDFTGQCGPLLAPKGPPKWVVNASFYTNASGTFHYYKRTAYYRTFQRRKFYARLSVDGQFVSQTRATGSFWLHRTGCTKVQFTTTASFR